MAQHVVIFKTGRLHELELACNTLKESGVPHYRQEETVSGLKTAMVTPAMGPGIYYNVLVPKQCINEAKELLNELPIDLTTDPDIWHFGTTEREKKGWKIYVWEQI